jgi:superfamily II DNA or RNA helicase
MKNLADLNLNHSYHKGENDVAEEFYLPCMARSTGYDRAVGFFKSSIYLLAWDSLKTFIHNGGEMRIICSPVLADDDQNAIRTGYEARQNQQIANNLQEQIESMLESDVLKKPTKVLSALVAEDIIDFKIASIDQPDAGRHERLFHDKLGLFKQNNIDEKDAAVVFKGSMNETWSGLSMDGNLESVDVFVSWGGEREQERVQSEQDYFDSLWNNSYDSVTVTEFPAVAEETLRSIADSVSWEPLVDEIVDEINEIKTESPDTGSNQRTPFPHQRKALDSWRDANHTGIFKHATGSGKTFTALCAIREGLKSEKIPAVFVPNTDILSQWEEELKTTNQDLNPDILVCGGGKNNWRDDSLLRSWTRPTGEQRIVLTTMQTAITEDFQSLFQEGEHIFLIADEVHRIGSPERRKILNYNSGWRLGLSATPRRYGDPDGTEKILEYFDGIIQPPFTLTDAIKSNRLTPYFYHIHKLSLTTEEQDRWEDLTKEIKKRYAQSHASDQEDLSKLPDHIKKLQIQRANILKKARNKIELACEVVKKHYSPGDRWLVYCADIDQLEEVRRNLNDVPFTVLEYHSKMKGDREETLKFFKTNGGIILSIKCLDEGVDIPNATHALILASSKNPREFIQRRGRVLRQSKNKHHARIHDTIVMPHTTETESPVTTILEGELARAIKFGQDAENPKSVADLKEIAIEAGIDYEDLADTGIEDD